MKSEKEKSKKKFSGWHFLSIIISLYLITMIFSFEKMISALNMTKNILGEVAPVFIVIIVLMIFTNYFAKNKKITKFLTKQKGWKGWIVAIIAGTISSGPIYMWYPLLKDLKKEGLRTGLIATFLYNRSIKIQFIPLIITYFGLTYTIVLTMTIMFISVVQGWVVEKIINKI